MTPQSRILLLGNLDVAAAESFWAAKDVKLKNNVDKIQEILLAGTKKYLAPLGLDGDGQKVAELVGQHSWIRWTDAAPEVAKVETKAIDPMSSAPSVVSFDEATGRQLNQQVDFSVTKEAVAQQVNKLPWREWRKGIAETLGQNDADKAAAVAVLASLHQNIPVELEPIEMWVREGSIYVTATCMVKPEDILLPPCVPKQAKVFKKSEHPYAAVVKLKVRRPTDQDKAQGEGEQNEAHIMRSATYFVNPEFKMPKLPDAMASAKKQGNTNNAEAAVAAGGGGGEHHRGLNQGVVEV